MKATTEIRLTLDELGRASRCEVEHLVELVHEGALDAAGDDPAQWRFESAALLRARRAARLMHDLDLNVAAVALVLDLLDELQALRAAR